MLICKKYYKKGARMFMSGEENETNTGRATTREIL